MKKTKPHFGSVEKKMNLLDEMRGNFLKNGEVIKIRQYATKHGVGAPFGTMLIKKGILEKSSESKGYTFDTTKSNKEIIEICSKIKFPKNFWKDYDKFLEDKNNQTILDFPKEEKKRIYEKNDVIPSDGEELIITTDMLKNVTPHPLYCEYFSEIIKSITTFPQKILKYKDLSRIIGGLKNKGYRPYRDPLIFAGVIKPMILEGGVTEFFCPLPPNITTEEITLLSETAAKYSKETRRLENIRYAEKKKEKEEKINEEKKNETIREVSISLNNEEEKDDDVNTTSNLFLELSKLKKSQLVFLIHLIPVIKKVNNSEDAETIGKIIEVVVAQPKEHQKYFINKLKDEM
jgi:hypothetical protein